MIRHIVLFKTPEIFSDQQLEDVRAPLMALQTTVPGIIAMDWGTNVSPEGFAQGYTHGFTVYFQDVAARDGYLVDADHAAAGKRLFEMCGGDLLVFDFEI
jgi:hypothetical protein